MAKVRPIWWLPIALFLVAGIVSALPGEREGLFYSARTPQAPLGLAALWFLALLTYRIGRWYNSRGLR